MAKKTYKHTVTGSLSIIPVFSKTGELLLNKSKIWVTKPIKKLKCDICKKNLKSNDEHVVVRSTKDNETFGKEYLICKSCYPEIEILPGEVSKT